MRRAAVVAAVNQWYAASARPLPWREPGTTAWGIVVSEFMAQQTPVARVIEPWRAWMHRWPTPAALAASAPAEAVLAWGRLGYPRRALRLHATAVVIVEQHGGRVPRTLPELRALPGVGEYTAAAVASFAFGARAVVLDTNVRRVLARIDAGQQFPANSTTAAERAMADRWLPADPAAASRWAAASMELGALVCTAAAPRCGICPAAQHCAWLRAGRPAHDGPARRAQRYSGTDRQARGRLLEALRTAPGGVQIGLLLAQWPADPDQAHRALDGLLADGLAHRSGEVVTL
ncbi:adenine glycosylase [Propionibacterium cyclohexanicum]|nr:adenine glycosylase [Propionibacterium cyclohexanicum]